MDVLRRRPGRAAATGAIVFAIALAAYIVNVHGDTQHLWSMIDLQVYRWGGEAARHHHNVYELKFGNLSFTYTPLALLGFELMSYLSIGALRFVMTGASIAALGGTLWLAWGVLGVPRSAERLGLTLGVAGIGLGLEPIAQTLAFGQINLLLMLLILYDLCRGDDRPWKGAGVGLAAAIKLTPAIFIGYLLVTRRFRATAVACLTFAAGTAAGFLLLPGASRSFWLDRLFLNPERVGGVPYAGNQSMNGALVRAFASVGGAKPAWLLAAGIVGAAGLVIAAWASARGKELLGILTCAVTALEVSPISWSHHWVWIAPIVVYGVHLLLRSGSRAGWVGLAALVVAFAAGPARWIWRVPNTANAEYRWHGSQLVAGNLYVLVGLVLLALAAVALARMRAADGDGGVEVGGGTVGVALPYPDRPYLPSRALHRPGLWEGWLT